MNPDTEKNVNEAIDWLQKTGGAIQDFAVEQAPLYCREVVAWQLYSGLAAVVLSLILGGIAWRLLKYAKQLRDAELDRDGGNITISDCASRVSAVFVGIFALVAFGVGGFCAVKAAVAPRLVIVEHLRSLK